MTTMPYRFPRAGSATRSSPVKATTPFHGWSTGTNTSSITHHIDWNGKGFTPYDLYCTQDLTGMIADGSLASIREDARTIFKDRPLTDDYLFANSIWPEPELLGLVDDLTGRTGRNL